MALTRPQLEAAVDALRARITMLEAGAVEVADQYRLDEPFRTLCAECPFAHPDDEAPAVTSL